MHAASSGVLYFEGFALDLLRCELRRGDEEIPLRSRALMHCTISPRIPAA